MAGNKNDHYQRQSRRMAGFVFMCVIVTVIILLIVLLCCCCHRRRRAAAAAAAGVSYAMLPHHMQYRGTPQYDPYSQAMQPAQPMQFTLPVQAQAMQPVHSAGGAPIYYYPMPQQQPAQAQAPRVVVVHTPQAQPYNGQPHSAAQQLA